MENIIKRARSKKGFTLIELIVVIAVLAILVLLAAPRLIGQTDKASLARIQNDVRAVENKFAQLMIIQPEIFNQWETVDEEDLQEFANSENIFGRSGVVTELEPGEYREIDNELLNDVNTTLEGNFYVNEEGTSYYYEDDAETRVDYSDLEEYLLATYAGHEWIGHIIVEKGELEEIRADGTGVYQQEETNYMNPNVYQYIEDDDRYIMKEIEGNMLGKRISSGSRILIDNVDNVQDYNDYYTGTVAIATPNPQYTSDVETQIEYHHVNSVTYAASNDIDNLKDLLNEQYEELYEEGYFSKLYNFDDTNNLQELLQKQYDVQYDEGFLSERYKVSVSYITLNDGDYMRLEVNMSK